MILPDDPPPGDPWDAPFARCPFALIDCEMTGPDPARDALLEVAVLRVEGGAVVDAFESLVHTETPSHPHALAMHGITPESLVDAPRFEAIAPRLAGLVAGAIPVMHGADLDVVFLERAYEPIAGASLLGPALDTVLLARRVVHTRTYGLSALAARLSLRPRRWHRAGEDVRAVYDLFAHVTGVLRPETARALWEVRVGQDGPARVRGSFELLFTRMQGSRHAVSLLVRTPGHDATTLVARIERWTPPYLHLATGQRGANGVRVLRADRVLYAEESSARVR